MSLALPSFENGQKWSTMVKNGQNGQTGKKIQIYKVQYRRLQMSSSIRLQGGDSMSLTSPSINNFVFFCFLMGLIYFYQIFKV